MLLRSKLKSDSTFIDLTPFVDVIFLLLIFFMMSFDLTPLRSLNISIPHLEKSSLPLTTQLMVILDAQHVIYVGKDQKIVDFSELPSFLKREVDLLRHYYPEREVSVLLSVDKKAAYGPFLQLFSLIQEISPRIRLAYQTIEIPDREENSLRDKE